MRLRILLEAERTVSLPADHIDALRGVLYRLLGMGNAEYAHELHEAGMGEGPRKLKPFTFSTLRVPRSRRRITGDRVHFAPGPVEWLLASPLETFLRHEVEGLLQIGSRLTIAGATLRLCGIEAIPTPDFSAHTDADGLTIARCTCLTPIVASIPAPDGRPTAYYLRPRDADAFSERVRHNLLKKYALIHGVPPDDDRLTFTFDPAYLARDREGGCKNVTIHACEIKGAFAPFTLAGSPALLTLAWDAGLGEKTGLGFGMIDICGGA